MAESISNISELPGSFVSVDLITSFEDNEALDVAKSIAPAISELLSHPSESALDALFHPDAFWRDHVSLSWSLRTFHPCSVIADKVLPLLKRAEIIPSSIVLQEEHTHAIKFPNGVSVIRAPFTFSTSNPTAQCTAALKTYPYEEREHQIPTSLDVLVVGGGHGDLSISAYFKSLGINFAMVEKQLAIGDSWAKRYDSATLHTTRLCSGLPFVPFPSDYPLYVPAKLIASYYAKYAQDLQLPTYPGRECVSAVWDDAKKQWTVTLVGVAGTEVVSARNLVFAVGIGGRWPIIPDFPGKDSFLGQSLHSSVYKDASLWAGKRVAIVGSSTTACDVALDCSRVGADVTIIQRGPTRIYPQEHITALLNSFWNSETPVEVSDVMAAEDPVVLQATLGALMLARMKDNYDPEYYEGLRKAGFLATVYGPIHQQIFFRGGGHYPDIGACDAISRGEIKVKSGAKIETIVPNGIAFSDGTQLDADAIVYATGFEKDVRRAIAAIVGTKQAALLEPVWGLDAEGEVHNALLWKGTSDRVSDVHNADLRTQFLALQIAAEIAKDPKCKELDAEVLKNYIFGGHVAEYTESLEEEGDEHFKK
ncbi:hypothetical protein MVEN_01597700 [Mycena venus]|uniref:FAD/NAD(P)-binding domain-containing protein n=1 Tax=Mycena venus TaxID=2733690 RepID=A0A8H6XSU1_9AGAR|nr:hypothetical protein MVEN_01597700 [Mycena venus]